MATVASRPRRSQARGGTCGPRWAGGKRGGSQRRPSKISTVVTVSTISWVSARSGADSHRKVTLVARPVPPTSASAASRWYLAFQAAATAQPAPISQSSANSGWMPPSGGTAKACSGRASSSGTATMATINTSSCGCRRRVPVQRSSQAAPCDSASMVFS